MSITKYLFTMALVCLYCSCNYEAKKQNEYLLNRATHALNQQPETALAIIDSVETRSLNEQQYNRFITLKVRARDKAGINIAADTIVFNSRDYFVTKKDRENAAFACFVSARVYESQDENSKAIMNYQNANEWAKHIQNDQLSGHINYGLGRLFYIQQLYAESAASLKQANMYYNQSNSKYEQKIYTLELIALDYFYWGQKDSALIYFDQAMKLATDYQDSNYKRRIFQSMAITFCKAKEFGIAKEKCMKAIALTNTNDSIAMGQLYSTLASIYNGTERIDSASYYGYKAKELLKKSDNLIDRAYLYEVLASIEQKRGKSELSLQYTEDGLQQLDNLELMRKAALLNQFKDKTFQQIIEERDNLKDQNIRLVIAVIFLVLLVVVGILWTWYRQTKIELKQQITAKMELINAYSNLKVELSCEISSKSRIQEEAFAKAKEEMNVLIEGYLSEFRTLICNDLDRLVQIYREVSVLTTYANIKNNEKAIANQSKKIKLITERDQLISVIHVVYPEWIKTIQSLPVNLDELEFFVACLAYARFENNDIAIILSKPSYTIPPIKTSLCRKLGLKSHNFREKFDKKYLTGQNNN